MYTAEALDELNARGDRLRGSLNAVSEKHGAALIWTGLGSMLMPHFLAVAPTTHAHTKRCDDRLKCAVAPFRPP